MSDRLREHTEVNILRQREQFLDSSRSVVPTLGIAFGEIRAAVSDGSASRNLAMSDFFFSSALPCRRATTKMVAFPDLKAEAAHRRRLDATRK